MKTIVIHHPIFDENNKVNKPYIGTITGRSYDSFLEFLLNEPIISVKYPKRHEKNK